MHPVRRKLNHLTWNKTLEYFARVYSRLTHIYDEHIVDLTAFCKKTNLIQIPYNADQYEEIYEMLSNVTEYFDVPSDLDLPAPFYHLSATNKVTQMGCDYAHTEGRTLKLLRILCFYNYPVDDWFAKPSRKIAKCLHRDHSLSFLKCSVDSPCNKSPIPIRMSLDKLHLFCLVLLKINF
ncbi:hypothetical protein EG68_04291 [Paragonimus skrjabini miyazakii]|uniref:Uncharacterized protein n=1 Tax=Paragonimus skrjabini miyazakii TaxID=59628 RepID=A0A8S9YSR2_9TREM|nr:hypothetical protein EG68_04291 [Paragonimus skrjabini miyazakii]